MAVTKNRSFLLCALAHFCSTNSEKKVMQHTNDVCLPLFLHKKKMKIIMEMIKKNSFKSKHTHSTFLWNWFSCAGIICTKRKETQTQARIHRRCILASNDRSSKRVRANERATELKWAKWCEMSCAMLKAKLSWTHWLMEISLRLDENARFCSFCYFFYRSLLCSTNVVADCCEHGIVGWWLAPQTLAKWNRL